MLKSWKIYTGIGALFAISTATADGLRCGADLVSEGESVHKLIEACGEPVEGDMLYTDFGRWTYNFGPDEFMMRVTIRAGIVERVERLGYGYVDENC